MTRKTIQIAIAFLARPWRGLAVDRKGSAAAEFGLIAPVFLTILFGIIKFGIVYNNYLPLIDAVRASARQLAVSRGSSTPYTDTTSAFYTAAPTLVKAKVTLTLTVPSPGTCTADAGCSTALSTASGQSVSVTAKYANCDLDIMGFDFAPNCKLTATTTERLE